MKTHGRPRAAVCLTALVVLAGLVAGLLGCGGGEEPGTPARTPTPLDLATTGSIAATVTYEGTPPTPAPVNMRSTPACAAAHPDGVRDTALLVRDGRVAGAIVYVAQGLGARVFATLTEPVIIDQRGCLYEPRISAAMVGQPITFVNSDPEAHNVHGWPKVARGWNFLMSRPKSERTISIDTAEVAIRIGCDIHPWMQAYIATFEHPYFGVTPASGRVVLERVPAGDYTIAVWHERLGAQEQPVSVTPQGTAEVTFVYRRAAG